VEYALLLAVVAVGTAGVLALLQGTLVGVFTNVRNTLLPYAGP
jgi:Flp pilus assembly pilin Flp